MRFFISVGGLGVYARLSSQQAAIISSITFKPKQMLTFSEALKHVAFTWDFSRFSDLLFSLGLRRKASEVAFFLDEAFVLGVQFLFRVNSSFAGVLCPLAPDTSRLGSTL